MILPDVNVLLYAVNTRAAQHAAAKDALDDAYRKGSVALAWNALLGFLRISTRPGVLQQTLAIQQALEITQRWLEHPHAVIVQATQQHAAVLSRLLLGAGRGGPLVSDAHFAALAIEHRATLLSFDRDFERFAGLRLKHLE